MKCRDRQVFHRNQDSRFDGLCDFAALLPRRLTRKEKERLNESRCGFCFDRIRWNEMRLNLMKRKSLLFSILVSISPMSEVSEMLTNVFLLSKRQVKKENVRVEQENGRFVFAFLESN